MRDGPEEMQYVVSSAPAEKRVINSPSEQQTGSRGAAVLPGIANAQWSTYALWAGYALLALGVALRLWPLSAAATDYDEGVYWQSLRAMTQGHPLYTSVFSSQPPVFLAGVYPFFLALGQSLAAARLGVIVYSLIGIGAVYVIGRLTAGPAAGLLAAVLLVLDPIYVQESRTLQAEVPALCWALVGIALAAAAWRTAGGRRHWFALGSGVAIALGIGAKLFDVVALVPAALYLASPIGATLIASDGRLIRRIDAQRMRAAVRAALPDLGLLLAGLVIGTALYLVPLTGAWPSLYDQVVRFHLRAGTLPATGLKANIKVLASLGGELPIELASLLAFIVAIRLRLWRTVPLIAWAAAALVLLLDQRPLFTHHVALLAPPLAILVAVVAVMAWQASWQTPWQSAPSPTAAPAVRRRPRQTPVVALALVALLALWGLGAGVIQATQAHGPTAQQIAIAGLLSATTQPGDYVLTDDQYLVGLANRDVPPQLVDTSSVRILSGYLTATQLQQAAQEANVRAVLIANGRFDQVPGFRAWVAAHFKQVADFGHGITLYVRVAQAPVAA
jgi:hypothetical protein